MYLINSVKNKNICLRPYHAEYTGSRPITEVKQRRAQLVLGWESNTVVQYHGITMVLPWYTMVQYHGNMVLYHESTMVLSWYSTMKVP